MDVFDDPTHGRQPLSLFHGHDKQSQYEPRVLIGAETGTVVMASLLHGTAPAALGAADDLASLVARLRQVWPDVEIRFRADSGFAVPALYEACERLEVTCTIGIKRNPVLDERSAELLEQAQKDYRRTGAKQRLVCGFWCQAGSWSRSRWTVIKCEAHAQGTNRRAVLTNRPGAPVLPGAADDEYTQRGDPTIRLAHATARRGERRWSVDWALDDGSPWPNRLSKTHQPALREALCIMRVITNSAGSNCRSAAE